MKYMGKLPEVLTRAQIQKIITTNKRIISDISKTKSSRMLQQAATRARKRITDYEFLLKTYPKI